MFHCWSYDMRKLQTLFISNISSFEIFCFRQWIQSAYPSGPSWFQWFVHRSIIKWFHYIHRSTGPSSATCTSPSTASTPKTISVTHVWMVAGMGFVETRTAREVSAPHDDDTAAAALVRIRAQHVRGGDEASPVDNPRPLGIPGQVFVWRLWRGSHSELVRCRFALFLI